MGQAPRGKRGRRGSPPPVGKAARRPRSRRIAWLATAPPLLIAAVVIVSLVTRGSAGAVPPPAKEIPAVDRHASPELVKAADAIGFHPSTAPGVGTIEEQPASAARPPSNPDLLPIGSQAPGFTLKTPTGETVSLADYRGNTVLIEFFATWCPHCAAEAPHLAKLAHALRNAAFISVNADGEDAASVFAYHRYFGLAFPALLDPSAQPGSFHREGAPGPVTHLYRVQSYPTLYVIGPGGRVTWRSDGEQPDALLRQALNQAAGR
jgi:thiol-disulfide isomerase/thioredoxin